MYFNKTFKKTGSKPYLIQIINSTFSQEAYNLLRKIKVSNEYNAKYNKIRVVEDRVQRKILLSKALNKPEH